VVSGSNEKVIVGMDLRSIIVQVKWMQKESI
jgi:hypothetical protein